MNRRATRIRLALGDHRTSRLVVGIVAVGVAAGLVAFVLSAQTSASSELAGIKGQLLQAIKTDYDQGMATNVRPGHMTESDRAGLRKRLTDQGAPAFSQVFTGDALTGRISNHAVWVSELTSSGAVAILNYEIKDFKLDPPVITGTTSTVSGTYAVHFKNGQDMPKGMVTWGGTSTQAFSAILTKENGRWLVSSYSERQLDEVDNADDSAGWDNLPSAAPKTGPASFAPLPVKP